MSKSSIAAALKRLREQSGMKADDVGALIGKSGKTVNAWENGRVQPDAEMLIKLSVLYKVENLLAEFDENNELNQVAKPEQTILTTDEKQLLNLYNSMNDEGKEKALERLEEMAAYDRYKKEYQSTLADEA